MRSLVVGTAGHIDHGKSALVKALTGTDPDRLKEEQARGITIDLGFAHAAIGDVNVAFVDVPGHERFVRNMLAGVGGIDAVLLVVAADESVKPQTREHFEICRLLGIARGLIVLTKSDLVDADTSELAALEARELVARSALKDAPVIAVSAKTGAGLDQLRAALVSLAGAVPRQARPGVVRLPVDRVFTVKGFGTVVTGTLVSGRVADHDELVVLPEGRRVRVRGVQVHGRTTPAADAPRRVALNLGAIEVRELARGVTLASDGSLSVTRRLDARIELVAGARPLRHGARVRVHQGTSELFGRVAICAMRLAADDPWRRARIDEASVTVPSGGEAYVRIRLERPAVLTRLDRVVIRACSPTVTIGGGLVLDPEPPTAGVRRAPALARFERLDPASTTPAEAGPSPAAAFLSVWLGEAGADGVDARDLVRRGGMDPDAARAACEALVTAGLAVVAGPKFVGAGVVSEMTTRVTAVLTAFHREHPADAGAPREAVRERAAPHAPPALFQALIASLAARGVVSGTDRLALVSHKPVVADEEGRQRAVIEDLLRRAALTPPDRAALAASAGVAPEVLDRLAHALVRERRIVKLDTLWFHVEPLAILKDEIKALRTVSLAGKPATVDVATFKSRYGLSRKYAIPLLEWLDRERVTRRVGEGRVVL